MYTNLHFGARPVNLLGMIDSVCTLRMLRDVRLCVCARACACARARLCVCSRVFTELITNRPNIVRFDAVTSVLMKICLFRDMIPCRPVFVGTKVS